MIQETFSILVVLSAVFVAGASVGQLWLRHRLATLQKANLELETKRLSVLKKAFHSSSIIIEHRGPKEFEREVRDEIEEILGEIENS